LREEFLASSTGPSPGPAVDDASRVVSNIVSSLFMYKAKAATTRARDFLSFSGHEALVRLRVARRSDAISPVALTARESSSERLGSSHCCAAAGGTYAPPPCPSEGFPSGTP
jgi:hypothetical protein